MKVARVLDRDRAALVVVDVQEAFRPVVRHFDRLAHNAGVLIQGAREMGIPVIATEQYPRGLGETVPEVAEHLEGAGAAPLEKTVFGLHKMEGSGAVPTSVETALFELLGAAGSVKAVQRLVK